MMNLAESILKKHLNPEKEYLFGFANLEGLTGEQFSNYPYGISIGRRLDTDTLDAIKEGPTHAYYEHYKEINHTLSDQAGLIAGELKNNAIEALVVEPSISTEEMDVTYGRTLRTELSHKMVATRAGLGWIGKTALLVSRKFGPRVRFVTILTDTLPATTGVPIDRSLCGKCTVCVDACPPSAASGKLWDTGVDRDEFFDAHRCRETCRRFGEEGLGPEARVCGICVAVCPIGNQTENRSAKRRL